MFAQTQESNTKRSASLKAHWARKGRTSRRLPGLPAECEACHQTKPADAFRVRTVGNHEYLRPLCRPCEHQQPELKNAIKRWQEKHRDVMRITAARYRRRYPEIGKVRYESWRARTFNTIDAVSLSDWETILEQYGWRCAYCGCGGRLTQDHIFPLTRGGKHEVLNVVPACKRCNSSKRDRTLEEWGKPLRSIEDGRSKNQGLTQAAPDAGNRAVHTRLFAGTPENPTVLEKSDNPFGAGNQQGRPIEIDRNPQRPHAEHP